MRTRFTFVSWRVLSTFIWRRGQGETTIRKKENGQDAVLCGFSDFLSHSQQTTVSLLPTRQPTFESILGHCLLAAKGRPWPVSYKFKADLWTYRQRLRNSQDQSSTGVRSELSDGTRSPRFLSIVLFSFLRRPRSQIRWTIETNRTFRRPWIKDQWTSDACCVLWSRCSWCFP